MRLYFYYSMFAVALIAAIFSAGIIGKRTGIAKPQTILFTITGFIAGILGAELMAIIYNAVLAAVSPDEVSSKSNVSLYGGLLFMPVMVYIITRVAKVSYSAIMDMEAAGIFMTLFFGKIGCHVEGCCAGIECSFGVINPMTGLRVFPVQLVEALFTLLIIIVLYIYLFKKKDRTSGYVYPIGLIMYSVCRFFSQFVRFHQSAAEDSLLGPLDFWQLVSIISVIAGVTWIIVLKKTKQNVSEMRIAA